jgi:hypothetical protein
MSYPDCIVLLQRNKAKIMMVRKVPESYLHLRGNHGLLALGARYIDEFFHVSKILSLSETRLVGNELH